jgi:hypothetical protein
MKNVSLVPLSSFAKLSCYSAVIVQRVRISGCHTDNGWLGGLEGNFLGGPAQPRLWWCRADVVFLKMLCPCLFPIPKSPWTKIMLFQVSFGRCKTTHWALTLGGRYTSFRPVSFSPLAISIDSRGASNDAATQCINDNTRKILK